MPDGFPYRFTVASFVAQAAASGHIRPGDEERFGRCFRLYADDLVERGHWRREADGYYSVNRRAASKMAFFATRIDPATARLRRIQRAKAAIHRHEGRRGGRAMNATAEAHLAVIAPELIAAVLDIDEAIVLAALHLLAERGEVWRITTEGPPIWLYVKGNGPIVAADLYDLTMKLKKEQTNG